jgi:1,4-dihydroxy-2-naphthoate octaprenyltransferase
MVESRPYRFLRSTYYFARLGRPLFLIGGFVLHGLGAVMALSIGASFDISALIWGQVAITATQLMTHYSNDYFDLAADKANPTPTRWSGGSRVLPEGHIDSRAALGMAVAMGLLAAFASLWLAFVVQTGPLTLPLLLLALILAWSYSSPPLQLNMYGFGELTGALLITGLTPIVGYYLQANQLDLLPFLGVFPLCCFQFAMLLVINFPDAAGDLASGKRTLLSYVGEHNSVRLHGLVLFLAYALLPLLVLMGLPLLAALALLAISPMALWLGWRIQHGAWADPSQWDSLGFWSIGLVMSSSGVELLAFLWLALPG